MKVILSFLIIINSFFAYSQKQANTWYFGKGAGLDFNDSCQVNVLTDGKIDGFEGCASISDRTTGQILFYTNSDTVWNRNHIAMPNGHMVGNGSTITQVMIIEKPGSNSTYYIITSDVQAQIFNGLLVHEIDMNLNAGLGGLTFKDSLLYGPPLTEKITAVRHANGSDIWVLAHEYNSNDFLAFLFTSSGFSTTPVISSIGKVHGDPSTVDAIGEMKASPNGSKIAVVTSHHPDIELFDFNRSTGQITNQILLPENGGYSLSGNPCGLYGLSFSANSKMLYATTWNLPSLGAPGLVIQYDVSSNDSATIDNSRVDVFTGTKSLFSLKLAPDRKIYVGQQASNYLDVINFPDSAGLACGYAINGIYLDGKIGWWGLNNVMEYNYYCDEEAPEITVPNVFSPNGDGINDYIDFSHLNLAEEIVDVYNRWGKKVFVSSTSNTKWDGSGCTEGTYYYVFHYSEFINKKIDKKGFIQLVR